LQTEINDAESKDEVGDLRGKLILNPEAALCTDLDRAQEVLNRDLTEGKSSGGTGRGIGPTAGDRLTRRGLAVGELFAEDWEERFSKAYTLHEKEFNAHGRSLAETDVPDLKATNEQKTPVIRKLGTKQEYMARLAEVRRWFIERDASLPPEKRLLQNTFNIYREAFNDLSHGFLFEGAQAVGLDPNFGRIPDVTSTDTTIFGIAKGTQFPLWDREHIREKIGVVKLTYMSSVGAMHMPTDSGIARKAFTQDEILAMADPGQRFAAAARMRADEFGATTGRARDICFQDLPILRYNSQAGGVEMLAGTHLDIAHEGEKIKVCTHYTDMAGNYVPYQPGIEHQQNIIPQYIELDGWDGEATRKASSFEELPDNAKKFLAFLQRSIGRPIVFVTTGPERENNIEISRFEP
jgi:adenylosuccinate synthase